MYASDVTRIMVVTRNVYYLNDSSNSKHLLYRRIVSILNDGAGGIFSLRNNYQLAVF